MVYADNFSLSPTIIRRKLRHFCWPLLFLLALVSGIGIMTLYAAARGEWQPWALPQLVRFGFGALVMIALSTINPRIWLRYAYPIYGVTFLLLVYVEVAGEIGMGAQRWIDLGFFQLQPSEMMKIALVLALARYFHGLPFDKIGSLLRLIVPSCFILAPAALVMLQPDLGTAGTLGMIGLSIFWLAGVRWWKFVVIFGGLAGAGPVAWNFLRDYQKNRVLTFLNPESDPLGAGYHIIQSKIALGSGGITGKGYMQSTQALGNFLPERHTDFIFSMLAEEWGMVGGLTLLALYMLILAYGLFVSLRIRNYFGRLLAAGVTINLFIYVIINTAMVMGLIPVVGVPLPFVSYGGTVMVTLLAGFGLLASAHVHRDLRIGRHGEAID